MSISNFIFLSTKSALVARCTAIDVEPTKKRKVSEEVTTCSPSLCETMSLSDNNQPLHIISDWIEPGTHTKRVVHALLPSGVLPGDFLIRIEGDGCGLYITMSWPESLINLKMLHLKWIQSGRIDRIKRYHPKIISFERLLKLHRGRSRDEVETASRINLPFKFKHKLYTSTT